MSTQRELNSLSASTWTPDGESIVEHVAGVEDYQVALATYRAACQRWPGIPITLRHGARVIEDTVGVIARCNSEQSRGGSGFRAPQGTMDWQPARTYR